MNNSKDSKNLFLNPGPLKKNFSDTNKWNWRQTR